MNILFRADSSSFIGTGHIMRDLVLTEQYTNDNITFSVRELKGNVNQKIDDQGLKKVILKTNDFQELDILIKDLKIDMVIIDHYGIDYNFEKKLKKENPNLIIFAFDDTYEKHYCDIILNHNISGDETKYKDLVPSSCELRCGSKYTLLREEFINIKKEKKVNSYKTFFIAMGGADHSNINIKILKVLEKIPSIRVNIVTTTANVNLKKLIKYCKNKKWIQLHINSNKIARIMDSSDFAIVTPSVTVNEVYYLGLPMIGIKTADNQIDMYNYLKKNKYPVIDKFNNNKMKIAIKKLFRKNK